jgi:hypothetical protein
MIASSLTRLGTISQRLRAPGQIYEQKMIPLTVLGTSSPTGMYVNFEDSLCHEKYASVSDFLRRVCTSWCFAVICHTCLHLIHTGRKTCMCIYVCVCVSVCIPVRVRVRVRVRVYVYMYVYVYLYIYVYVYVYVCLYI